MAGERPPNAGDLVPRQVDIYGLRVTVSGSALEDHLWPYFAGRSAGR